jgi:hypothetical protein
VIRLPTSIQKSFFVNFLHHQSNFYYLIAKSYTSGMMKEINDRYNRIIYWNNSNPGFDSAPSDAARFLQIANNHLAFQGSLILSVLYNSFKNNQREHS